MDAATPRAFVLGGGVAGIAASFHLRDHGYEVELLEARSELGGRVFSLASGAGAGEAGADTGEAGADTGEAGAGAGEAGADTGEAGADAGEVGADAGEAGADAGEAGADAGEAGADAGEIDNGPHVLLGCYDEMRRLLRRLGTERDFEQPRTLCMHYRAPGGARARLQLARAPARLALPWAIAGLRAFTLGERARAVRGMLASLRRAPVAWSLEEWLRARGQHGAPRRYLWVPLCHAVMNAEPDEVSAELFLATLRRAFRGRAARAAIWLPKKPWSDIVGRAALAALARAGVRVTTGARVQRLDLRGDAIDAIVAPSVRRVGARDLVVSALPWHRLAKLLPPELAGAAACFTSRAIVNVRFDFGARPVLGDDAAVTALVDGTPFQFVYRRPGDPAGCFTLIAAGGRALAHRTVAEIEAAARAQLALYYPDAPLPEAGRSRVTKERDATLCAAPADVERRPPVGRHASVRNLWLCGDWTQTGLPSTLESAAASGFGLRFDRA
jgi:uncharacterized protein with NAD-binding domain and iron-sulfur cluster